MNLAELAGAIAADRNLCWKVIEAATQECGWPGLSVEQAVVLLGRERLAAQFLRTPSFNRTAQAVRRRPPGPLHREPKPGEPITANKTRGTRMNQVKALIVDDSSVMRKIVERSLRQAGLALSSVIEAGNGAEALGLLNAHPVDMILSDIHMPVMDGLEFVCRLQTIESLRGVPVVMITTEGSESNVVQALALGAKGYIRKPFTPDQVKECVLPLLGL